MRITKTPKRVWRKPWTWVNRHKVMEEGRDYTINSNGVIFAKPTEKKVFHHVVYEVDYEGMDDGLPPPPPYPDPRIVPTTSRGELFGGYEDNGDDDFPKPSKPGIIMM